METNIHPTAIIEEGAAIGCGVKIGPYSVIGPEVSVGDSCRIENSVTLTGKVNIGPDNYIGSGAVIGSPPQDVNASIDIPSRVEIGRDNVIREYVTIHRPSEEDGVTRIGDSNMLMAFVHVAHDCVLGNEINVANSTALGGYVQVGDGAFISGFCTFHQFVRVGKLAMVGMQTNVTQDIPPYILIAGHPARVHNINAVGLKRAQIPPGSRKAIRRAFKIIYRSGLNTRQALDRINEELGDSKECMNISEFISRSRRGILKKMAGEEER